MIFKQGQVINTFVMDDKELKIRTLKKTDIDIAMKYINTMIEEGVHFRIQTKVKRKEQQEWLEGELKSIRKGEKINLVIEDSGKMIGGAVVEKQPMDAEKHVANFGIGLTNKYREKGFGTYLMNLLLKLAKIKLNCKVARISVFSTNLRAIHVYEKVGFKETGKIPKGIKHKGRYIDEVILWRKL